MAGQTRRPPSSIAGQEGADAFSQVSKLATSLVKGDIPAIGNLVAASIGPVGQLGKAVVEVYAGVFTQVGELGTKLLSLAATTGRSAQEMQGLVHVAGRAGVSSEELGGALTGLAARLYSTSTGSVDAILAFSRLGVAVHSSSGGFRNAVDVYDDVIEKLIAIKDPTERAGKALAAGLPQALETANRFLQKGGNAADGIRAYQAAKLEVKEFGAELSGPGLRAIAAYSEAQSRLGLVAQGLKNSIAEPLFQDLSVAASKFLDTFKEKSPALRAALRSASEDLGKLGPGLAKLGGLALSLLAPLIKVVNVFAALAHVSIEVATAIGERVAGALQTLAPIAAVVGGVLLAPFLGATALFAGLALAIEDVISYTKGYESLTGEAIAAFKGWLDSFLTPQADDPWVLRKLKEILEVIRRLPETWEKFKTSFKESLPSLPTLEGTARKARGLVGFLAENTPLGRLAPSLLPNQDDKGFSEAQKKFPKAELGDIQGPVAPKELANTVPVSPYAPGLVEQAGRTPGLPFGRELAAAGAPAAIVNNYYVTNQNEVNVTGQLATLKEVAESVEKAAKDVWDKGWRSTLGAVGVK